MPEHDDWHALLVDDLRRTLLRLSHDMRLTALNREAGTELDELYRALPLKRGCRR